MKKSIALVALAFGVTNAFAQDLTSKKGEAFLPAEGDIAIGFSALPFIGTLGNLMAPNPNTTVTGTGGATNYIMGKYFTDEKTAFRGVLGLNFGTTKITNLVPVSGATVTPAPTVEDVVKVGSRSITLGAGYEKRRGSTRLQGYYGGMLMINLGGGKTTNTYGNAISATNPVSRATEVKAGSTFGLGINGFVGAEYFILPKISIGAEYWWGLGFTSTGKGETTTESWDGTAIKSATVETGKSSTFGINGKYGSGSIFLNLHF